MFQWEKTTLDYANSYVGAYHRHSEPVQGHKFSILAKKDHRIVGVAIIGRPIALALDNGTCLEIRRNCTDGTRNASSYLYGVCIRLVFRMLYEKIITYTLITEPGDSLRAVGFIAEAITGSPNWNKREGRENYNAPEDIPKIRWAKYNNPSYIKKMRRYNIERAKKAHAKSPCRV